MTLNSEDFQGVFYYFHTKYSNTTIKKLVKLEVTSTVSGRGSPYNAINPFILGRDQKDNWCARSKENSSFIIKLLRDRLKINSYAIRSRIDIDYNTPLELTLEGSNDNINWKLLHHKERNDELKLKDSRGNWTVNNNDLFKSFRITQIGENYYTNYDERYVFAFNKIELFGSLYPITKYTCATTKTFLSFNVILLICILCYK